MGSLRNRITFKQEAGLPVVAVPEGFEALADLLIDDIGSVNEEQLREIKQALLAAKETGPVSDLGFNSCYLVVEGDKIRIEHQWQNAECTLDLSELLDIFDDWAAFQAAFALEERL